MVAKAAEALGDRWSLLIVREMLHGASRFNELERRLPGISRSILAERLRTLMRAGVIERSSQPGRRSSYQLTQAGRELGPVVQSMGDWVARWILTEPRASELDPDLLLLWISRHMNADRFSERRVVVEFDLRLPRPAAYWLVLEPGGAASLCVRHPGFATGRTVGLLT